MRPRHPVYVYFIRQIEGSTRIKIGSSTSIDQRLYNLAAWSSEPLEVLAYCLGSRRLETQIHTHFVADHHHREWFKSSPELLAGISAVKSGVGCLEAFGLTSDSPAFRLDYLTRHAASPSPSSEVPA